MYVLRHLKSFQLFYRKDWFHKRSINIRMAMKRNTREIIAAARESELQNRKQSTLTATQPFTKHKFEVCLESYTRTK